MLGGDIGRHPRIGDHAGDRGGVHDRPAAGLQHLADLGLHAQEHPAQVDRHDLVEHLVWRIGQRLGRRQDAGVVEGAVQPAIGRDHGVHQRLHLLGRTHVSAAEEGLAAGPVDQGHGLLGALVDVADSHPRALLGEGQGRRAAYARRPAGDQDGLAGEIEQIPGHRALRMNVPASVIRPRPRSRLRRFTG